MSNNSNENNGHPAWQEILNQVPEEFHPLLRPTLEKWDKGVQDKIQSMHDQYAPLKDFQKFVDSNVTADYLVNAYNLAQNFQQHPGDVVKQAIEAFDLDYVDKNSISQPEDNDDEDFGQASIEDLAKHPAFKQVLDQLTSVQETLTSRQQQEEEAKQYEEWQAYLADVKERHGDIDEDYFTSLIAQGVSEEDAINRYKRIQGQQLTEQLNQQNDQSDKPENPPVLGADGNSGSGLEQQPINFGQMKDADVDDAVAQMLQAAQQNNQS